MTYIRPGVNLLLLLLSVSHSLSADTLVPAGYVRAAQATGLPALVAYAAALDQSGARVDNGCLQPWPWTLKIGGKRRHYPRRADAHAALVNALASSSVSVKAGLMQIDARSAGLAPTDLLEPAVNLAAGLRPYSQKPARYSAKMAAWLKQIKRHGFTSLCRSRSRSNTFVTANRGGSSQPSQQVSALINRLAPRYWLDPELVKAVVAQESGFNPRATSGKKAQGLMQLIPETQARFGVVNPYDPEDNLRGGARYLNWLLRHFSGDVALTLAAYNAGEKAVERYHGIPPYPETQNYVMKIRHHYPRRWHPVPPPIS